MSNNYDKIVDSGNLLGFVDPTNNNKIFPVAGNNNAINVNIAGGVDGTSIDLSGLTTTDYVYVVAGDYGADYATGSEGQIKTALTYPTGATTGDPALLLTYKYADTANPTLPTQVAATESTAP